MIDLLRGLHTPAALVGLARGIVEAGLMALVAAVALYITSDPRFIAIAPTAVAVERWLEGIIDHIDPEKKRAP
jgi:hypothetical protein